MLLSIDREIVLDKDTLYEELLRTNPILAKEV